MDMGSIWLVCAAGDRYARACGEVSARCHEPRFMRLGSASGVPDVARMFATSAAGAVIALDDAETAADLVRKLREVEWQAPILALVPVIDPRRIAALFEAGATEVIAADGAVGALDTKAACDEEELYVRGATAPAKPEGGGVDAVLEEPDSVAPALASDEIDWEEVPPWQIDRWASDATPLGDVPAPSAAPKASARDNGETLRREAAIPAAPTGPRAPLIAVISGRGGVGKTTLTACMAYAAASMGLRAAVLDLDLMFGNMYDMLGADEPRDLGLLGDGAAGPLDAGRVEATAMQLAPGVTLWGPCARPESAEVLSHPLEELIALLRTEADVLFVDTSTFWGDAVAMAVSQCDRCLVVGQTGSAPSCVRAIDLAARVGVAKTKMTAVFNRFGAPGNQEEQALRFEMSVALSSRQRIPDGASDLRQMAAFGRLGEYMTAPSAYANAVSACTAHLLKELGCDVSAWERAQTTKKAEHDARRKITPPWKRGRGDER